MSQILETNCEDSPTNMIKAVNPIIRGEHISVWENPIKMLHEQPSPKADNFTKCHVLVSDSPSFCHSLQFRPFEYLILNTIYSLQGNYYFASLWANDKKVMKALDIRKVCLVMHTTFGRKIHFDNYRNMTNANNLMGKSVILLTREGWRSSFYVIGT